MVELDEDDRGLAFMARGGDWTGVGFLALDVCFTSIRFSSAGFSRLDVYSAFWLSEHAQYIHTHVNDTIDPKFMHRDVYRHISL